MQLKCPLWQKIVIYILSLTPKKTWPHISKIIASLALSTNINRVNIAKTNISLCIKPCDKILKKNIANTIYSIFELLHYNHKNLPTTNLNTQTNFINALNQNKGLLIIHPHTLSMNLAGAIICSYVYNNSNKKFGYIYRPTKNEKSNNLLQYLRYNLGPNAHWFSSRKTTACIKFLRQGGVLMTFPDHDLGIERSVFSDFCGIQTATCPSFAKMAELGKANCIAIALYKKDDTLSFNNQEQLNTAQPDQKIADWLNHWVESVVKKNPAQYFWLHKRFKTRPDKENSLY